jgi:uncharacterized cupredoxin-like copper-binding protein
MIAPRIVLTVTVVGLVLASCSSSDSSSSASGGGDQTVDVTLQEFAVSAVPATVAAGTVTFNATNEGPDDQHELVVVKTDLEPTALPQKEDGSVDEEGEGIEVVDEIEEFDPNTTESLTLDLETGSYVLMCNIYDPDEDEAHYAEGMRLGFTVS